MSTFTTVNNLDYIRSKSDFNYDAAKILLDDYNNPVSSIHCSYYGSFQYLSWKLNSLGFSYDDIEAEIQSSKTVPPKRYTHVYPVEIMFSEMKTKIRDNGRSAKEFEDKIGLLKSFRILSDYKNVSITTDQANNAITLSKEIKDLLKKI